MAKSVLDIIIRTVKQGGGDKETVKGLVDLKSGLGTAAAAMAALAGAAYVVEQALDATVGVFVDYASQVRNVQFMTGATAEESSRLIQVADDMKISYDSLTKVMNAAVKNGIEPSIAGLAEMSDKYLALAPGQERANFLLQEFGKSGGEMAEMMSKGGDAIEKMAAGIDKGLILDPAALQSARDYETAIDNLNDSWGAVVNVIGAKVAPILTQIANGMLLTIKTQNDYNDALQEVIKLYGDHGDRANNMRVLQYQHNKAIVEGGAALDAHQAALDGDTDALSNNAGAMEDSAQAAADAAEHYGSLLSLTLDLQDGYDKFGEKEAEIRQKIEETNAAFAAGSMTADEHKTKLAELGGELDANAAAMEQWSKKTVFSLVQARLAASGGIDANEFAFLIGLGENMGLIDSKTAAMAQNVNKSMDEIDLSKPEDFKSVWEDIMNLPHEQTFTVTTVTSGSSVSTDSMWQTCFMPGTLITLGNGDQRVIEGMKVNDIVLTMEPETGATMQSRVAHVFLHQSDHYYDVKLNNGATLQVTAEHPLYSGKAWTQVKDLVIGSPLVTMQGEAAVSSIAKVRGKVAVYNLHVDHIWHTYFANGVLAHNKATGGVARGPGNGLQDTFLAPLANGEFVVNAQAAAQPGMMDLLHSINSGRFGGSVGGGGGAVTIYGGLTVVAQGGVRDVLDEMSSAPG